MITTVRDCIDCLKALNAAPSLASAASVYSGYEVDDDWCVSVLQSYQAEGDIPYPWSVGESAAVQAFLTSQHFFVVGFASFHPLFPSFQERT